MATPRERPNQRGRQGQPPGRDGRSGGKSRQGGQGRQDPGQSRNERRSQPSRDRGRSEPRRSTSDPSRQDSRDRGSARAKPGDNRRNRDGDRRRPNDDGAPKSWGGVARRGSRNVKDPGPGTAAGAWREAVARARGEDPDEEPWTPEVWIEEPEPEQERPASRRPAKTRSERPQPTASEERRRRGRSLAPEVRAELATTAGRRAESVQRRLADAAKAYERDRYRDALKLLRPLTDAAPESAAVRELHGLTLYRLGRWSAAVKELEAFRSLTGSYDQHPTLADCYRGLKRYRKVAEVWDELRDASPSAELVAEGRLVMAGALADRGDVPAAIALLEAAPGIDRKARARDHHLRIWYALADLYERAGELPRARELFRRVAARDRDLYDVGERLANLS